MEEHHDFANEPLFEPRFLDFAPAAGADPADFFESARIALDHVENLFAEMADEFLRVNRTNAFDHAAAKIFLEAFARGGRNCFSELSFELQAVFAVSHPMAFRGDPFAGGNRRERGDNRDEIAMTLHFHAKNTEASLFLEESDALDETGDCFGDLGRLGHNQ